MTGAYIAVFIGGGLGAVLRHAINCLALAYLGNRFPFGTLFVNAAGSLVMGVLAGLFASAGSGSQELRLFLTIGLLGGFTTFSAFSLEAALCGSEVNTLASPSIFSVRSCFPSLHYLSEWQRPAH